MMMIAHHLDSMKSGIYPGNPSGQIPVSQVSSNFKTPAKIQLKSVNATPIAKPVTTPFTISEESLLLIVVLSAITSLLLAHRDSSLAVYHAVITLVNMTKITYSFAGVVNVTS
jgi:hypothetical protein